MKKEEAIQVLESMKSEENYNALIDLCNMAIEALSVESTDLISRTEISAWLSNMGYDKLVNAVMDTKRFPSDDRPSGKWIIRENGNKECSLCGRERQDGWDYFCGYCGARMKGGIE